MSYLPCAEPGMHEDCPDSIEMIIVPRTGDIGNFEVHRALPFKKKQMVGPFIFWDQMGPGEFLTGQGLDVRPHPHIGLATVTYLFDGTMDHKDSLGNDMRIHPGDVNLMTAGSGIVHSERTGADIRNDTSRLFGIQSWMALPKDQEATDPAFVHANKSELPFFQDQGVKGRVILGNYEGLNSPVRPAWETLYVDLAVQAGASIPIPNTTEERALYVLGGRIEIAGTTYDPQQMMVLRPGDEITVKALDDVKIMLLGGAAMDGPRYIWWNFVSSRKDLMEQAKRDWREGKFPLVPGDEKEFITLPQDVKN